MSLESADVKMLGHAKKIIATKDKTVIVDGKGKKSDIDARATQIKSQIVNLASGAAVKFDRDHLEKRIARLTGGVAVIRVGAATETEMKYLKLKIEDAVNATKAAIEEGIVPGGGVALAKAAGKVEKKMLASSAFKKSHESKKETEFFIGYQALVDALVSPLRQIAQNAGHDEPALIVEKVKKSDAHLGYDASADTMSDEIELVDMLAAGIIDPVKVTRTALQNAASAAGILLTTDVAIADEPEEKKQVPNQNMNMDY
jgi:chaperonin GroEL